MPSLLWSDMPKSPKIKRQPNVLFEATVRRMLATPPQPKVAVNKRRPKKTAKK